MQERIEGEESWLNAYDSTVLGIRNSLSRATRASIVSSLFSAASALSLGFHAESLVLLFGSFAVSLGAVAAESSITTKLDNDQLESVYRHKPGNIPSLSELESEFNRLVFAKTHAPAIVNLLSCVLGAYAEINLRATGKESLANAYIAAMLLQLIGFLQAYTSAQKQVQKNFAGITK